MTRRLRVVCWVLTIAFFHSFAFGEDGLRIEKELAFSPSDPALTLDLYLPNSDTPVPCIITIQGGGFLPQNGQRFKPFAEHLAKNGFAAALISYRGRPKHHHRETLADVKDSVRYIRQVGNRYGIDTTRIGATGRSAGGTLAALLAVTGSDEDPTSQIQAAVCFAGVFDFVRRFTDEDQLDLQPNYKEKLRTNGEWIGTPFSHVDTEWLAASAIRHLDEKDPPILLLHSRNDATVPWQQSRDFYEAMRALNLEASIKIYETGGHSVTPAGEQPLDEMVQHFQRYFR